MEWGQRFLSDLTHFILICFVLWSWHSCCSSMFLPTSQKVIKVKRTMGLHGLSIRCTSRVIHGWHDTYFARIVMMFCVCIKCHTNALNGLKLQCGHDFVMDRHPYGHMGGQNTIKHKQYVSPPRRERHNSKQVHLYISRDYCVHFRLLTSDTFLLYSVHTIAFTSWIGLDSFCVYCYILRLNRFIAYIKKPKDISEITENKFRNFHNFRL